MQNADKCIHMSINSQSTGYGFQWEVFQGSAAISGQTVHSSIDRRNYFSKRSYSKQRRLTDQTANRSHRSIFFYLVGLLGSCFNYNSDGLESRRGGEPEPAEVLNFNVGGLSAGEENVLSAAFFHSIQVGIPMFLALIRDLSGPLYRPLSKRLEK
jgi:hypothetical protein